MKDFFKLILLSSSTKCDSPNRSFSVIIKLQWLKLIQLFMKWSLIRLEYNWSSLIRSRYPDFIMQIIPGKTWLRFVL